METVSHYIFCTKYKLHFSIYFITNSANKTAHSCKTLLTVKVPIATLSCGIKILY